MQVRIYQPTIEGDTSIESSLTIKFGTSTRSLNTQLGTLLTEIFERMDFYKSMGSRLCTCNAPLLVTFSTKNQTIDLGSIDEELVHKLKPSYNTRVESGMLDASSSRRSGLLRPLIVSTIPSVPTS